MNPSTPAWMPPTGEPHAGQAPLRILLVEDDTLDRFAVRRCLQQACAAAAETLERLGASGYNCLLLDYYLPDVQGRADLRTARRQPSPRPGTGAVGSGTAMRGGDLRTQEALFRTLAATIPQMAWIADRHERRS
jgi:CheY-like chemotaxis protein